MRKQIINRLGVAHIRDTVQQFVEGRIDRFQAMESLQVSKTRLYVLKTSYLAARAAGKADEWTPGTSGGNHMPEWPDGARKFLKDVLSPAGDAKRYSYAFAASELGRSHGLAVDRSQVRHWAIANGLARPAPTPRAPAHVRRWQRKAAGELWQLDAPPDCFLGRGNPQLHLIDMLDDSSRMQVGCRLCRDAPERSGGLVAEGNGAAARKRPRENVPAYLDLFYRAFTRYGLPLEIYVDRASFFRSEDGSLTQPGRRLKFFDVSFVFANTPEAKGKIERVHQVRQDRLPAYAAHEGITAETPLEDVNEHLACLVDYRNAFEIHREIHDTPENVWEAKIKGGLCKLRQPPRDGWWELVWAEWKGAVIGPRGRLLVDGILCPTECANGTRAWICRHTDGTLSLVLNKPEKGTSPKVVFTNNPRVNRG